MADNVNQKYIDEYIKNEVDANKQMTFANLFAGIAITFLWILFATKAIPLHTNIYIFVNIIFPINIIILVSPMFYLKSERIKKPGFKYFALTTFILVMGLINIVIPKHGILGWALCIIMVNHYYNPKLGRMVFISVLITMFICLYAGMFLGEYDALTLGTGEVNGVIVFPYYDGGYHVPDSPKERFDMLHRMLELGENRYLKTFLFYYLGRAGTLALIFFVSNSLNKRTYNLLINEIKVNTEQQTISTELNVAKEIQLSTLPVEFITNEDVEILAELRAAKEVGGDFYDYFNLGDHHVAVVIGDVSGKGIPAAMFMMKTITCFKNYVDASKMPSQILNEVNRTIYEGNVNQMFVTCFLAILDTKTGLLRYANAGHNPPIIGDNRNYRFLKCNSGFILGGMPQAYVKDEEVYLKNGESLTLYTDGITEARNSSGEFYGENRLLQFFNSKDFTCILQCHHDLKDDVAKFVKDAEQSDDMTYLTIKYHGDKYYYSEKLMPAKIENIGEMLASVEEFCEKYITDSKFKNNLYVVADELFSNVCKYAYKDTPGNLYTRLLYNFDKKEFVMTIIDTGVEFNQLDVNNSPISGKAEDQKIGGLGILIVKNIMSEYAYDRINDKNIITLRKKM